MFLSNWLVTKIVAAALFPTVVSFPTPDEFFLAFDGTNTLFTYGGSKSSVSNVTIYYDGYQHEMGNAYPVVLSEPGEYKARVDICGEKYLTEAVTVSSVNEPTPLSGQSDILAFHHGNFDNVYGDGDVGTAATNGHVYADTPTGDYNWGSLTGKTMTSTGTTYIWTPPESGLTANVLMVAGGGAGAGCWHGGGGGAGGLLTYTNQMISGQKTIVVGAGGIQNGGTPGTWFNGSDTSFTGYTTVVGGGKGGTDCAKPGNGFSGGSGGGATGYSAGIGGSGVTGQGNSGGNGISGRLPNGYNVGGGGGGAGGAGSGESSGGHGGVGVNLSNTFGTTYGDSGWFAGGGGGGGFGAQVGGNGGNGGGGYGGSGSANAQAGQAHTGGGGGGEGDQYGNRARGGGSGIVLLSYQVPPQLSYNTYDKLTLANTSNANVDSSLRLGSNVWKVGTVSNIWICKPGDYKSFTVDPDGQVAYFGSVTVETVTKTQEPSNISISFDYNKGGRTENFNGTNACDVYIYDEDKQSLFSTPVLSWTTNQPNNSWQTFSQNISNETNASRVRFIVKLTTGEHVPDTGFDNIQINNGNVFDFETDNENFLTLLNSQTLDVSLASTTLSPKWLRTSSSTSNGIYTLLSANGSTFIYYEGSGDYTSGVVHWLISPVITVGTSSIQPIQPTLISTSSTTFSGTVAFHHGYFDNVYQDGSVQVAATNGHVYVDTPTGTYSWGTLQGISYTTTGTTYTWTPPSGGISAHVLMVAGGGGGGLNNTNGGGGAGELVFLNNQTISGQQTIVVGAGGQGNNPGHDTNFLSVSANGGGNSGNSGGSGGGEGRDQAGNAGTSIKTGNGYGNNGGLSLYAGWGGSGGGGGAGAPGTNGNGNNTPEGEVSGDGGDGLYEVNIDGTLYNFATIFGGAIYGEVISGQSWFAGGGGGGNHGSTDTGLGGRGGGGNGRGEVAGVVGTNGINHTGGGAGGGFNTTYNGGSGIVILSSSTPINIINPSLTYDGYNKLTVVGAQDQQDIYKDSDSWSLGTASSVYVADPGEYIYFTRDAATAFLANVVVESVTENTGNLYYLFQNFGTGTYSDTEGRTVDTTTYAADNIYGSSTSVFTDQGWTVVGINNFTGTSVDSQGIWGYDPNNTGATSYIEKSLPESITGVHTLFSQDFGEQTNGYTSVQIINNGGVVAQALRYYSSSLQEATLYFQAGPNNKIRFNDVDVSILRLYYVLVSEPNQSPALLYNGLDKLTIANMTPTSSNLKFGSEYYDLGTASNIYIEDTGTYEVVTKNANVFAFTSNVVGTVSTQSSSPALVHNGLDKLSITGMTPTSSNLKFGSEYYDLGTASNIYIEDTGTYEVITKNSNVFAFTSNVVSAVSTQSSSPALVYDNTNKLSITGITPTHSNLSLGSSSYDLGTASNIYIYDTGTYEVVTKNANVFAFTSNVVDTVTSVSDILAYDGYNKLTLTGYQDQTLYRDSNSWSLGTASNVYVADPGEYIYFTRDTATAFLANVTVESVTDEAPLDYQLFQNFRSVDYVDASGRTISNFGTYSNGNLGLATNILDFLLELTNSGWEYNLDYYQYTSEPYNSWYDVNDKTVGVNFFFGGNEVGYIQKNLPPNTKRVIIQYANPMSATGLSIACKIYEIGQTTPYVQDTKFSGQSTKPGETVLDLDPSKSYYIRIDEGPPATIIFAEYILCVIETHIPSLTYDGITNLKITGAEPSSYITYKSATNDKLLACGTDLTTYPLYRAGGNYKAEVSGPTTFTFTSNVTVPEGDLLPLYKYPPDGAATSSLTESTAADTNSVWTLSGAAYGNGEYNARANVVASTISVTAYHAFDSNLTAGFENTSVNTGTLRLQLPSAETIHKYVVWPKAVDGKRPKSWTIEGSQDAVTWTTIHTVTDSPPSLSGDAHEITSPAAYVYYRINVTANNGGTGLEIAELALYGDVAFSITFSDGWVSTDGVKNIIPGSAYTLPTYTSTLPVSVSGDTSIDTSVETTYRVVYTSIGVDELVRRVVRYFNVELVALLSDYSSTYTSLNGAYSSRLLFKEYTGPHMRLRRSYDSAELDVTFDLNGNVVIPSDFNDWWNATTLYITTIYDQSGNNNHATGINNPVFFPDNSEIYLGTNKYFTLPDSTVPFGDSSYTFIVYHANLNSTNSGIIGSGTYGSIYQVNALRRDGNKYVNYWWAGDWSTGTYANDQVVAVSYDSSQSYQIFLTGTSSDERTASVNRNSTSINNTLGVTNGSEYMNGGFYDILIYNSALDLPTMSGISSILKPIPPAPPVPLYFTNWTTYTEQIIIPTADPSLSTINYQTAGIVSVSIDFLIPIISGEGWSLFGQEAGIQISPYEVNGNFGMYMEAFGSGSAVTVGSPSSFSNQLINVTISNINDTSVSGPSYSVGISGSTPTITGTLSRDGRNIDTKHMMIGRGGYLIQSRFANDALQVHDFEIVRTNGTVSKTIGNYNVYTQTGSSPSDLIVTMYGTNYTFNIVNSPQIAVL